ncbi:MAG: esterase family protein [Clostridiales bacterium]|nr:esterase family protein [Clostridiales bacterium]
MALLTMHFNSTELKMHTLVNVIIPDSVRIENKPLSERKVLWLLHGLSDDGSCWARFSRVEHYAEKYGLVVVMPSAGRSMYCDNVLGQNYFTHIAEELPNYLSLVFGLSRKKEDNFIAGLSMGGLGAAKLALTYPEKYSAVGSFSGVLNLGPLLFVLNDDMKNEFSFMIEAISDVDNSPLNPTALLDAEKDKDLKIYITCGLQDNLLITNYLFKERADELSIKAHYTFEDGAHTWEYWDRHIKLFIDFMLEK